MLSVCVPFAIELLSQLNFVHEISYEQCAIRDYFNVILFNTLQLGATTCTCELLPWE
jgi:hypothetical protein